MKSMPELKDSIVCEVFINSMPLASEKRLINDIGFYKTYEDEMMGSDDPVKIPIPLIDAIGAQNANFC
jgi:hypothetical protein